MTDTPRTWQGGITGIGYDPTRPGSTRFDDPLTRSRRSRGGSRKRAQPGLTVEPVWPRAGIIDVIAAQQKPLVANEASQLRRLLR
jgi:hypothetical protein